MPDPSDPSENAKPEDSGRSLWVQGPINTAKKILNKVGFKFHTYRTENNELPVRVRLLPLITVLQGRMTNLDKCEKEFATIEELMPKLAEEYKALGPYTTEDICKFFQNYYKNGWVDSTMGDPVLDYHVVDELPFQIRDPLTKTFKKFTIKVPRAREVVLPDGYIEGGLVVFGYSGDCVKMWSEYYREKAEEILEHFRRALSGQSGMVEHLEVIKSAFIKTLVFGLVRGERKKSDEEVELESIYGKDKRMEKFFSKTLQGFFAEYDTYYENLFKNVPAGCDHTYKVIEPVLFNPDGTVKDKIEDHNFTLYAGADNPDATKYLDELRHGLDHLGKPLEVTDDRYVYVDTKRFPNKKALWREVPEQFIRLLPLHEIAAYLANEWDAYRDDLRDGRWHSESLTVMEYIQSVVPALGREWKTKMVNEIPSSKFHLPNTRGYRMKIQSGGITKWIRGEREPSQTNPSFDIRAMSRKYNGGTKWRHAGRLFYYDDVGGLNDNNEPHLSSRGLSMFIIDRVCREGKSLAEIQEDLKLIAAETGGFDYGPRTMDGAPSFCMDPFQIDLAPVIESIKKKEASGN